MHESGFLLTAWQSHNGLTNDCLSTISQLGVLKELRLGANALTGELSGCIGNLSELEILDVQENKISSLPEDMGRLSHLRILNVGVNQLSELPMEALSQAPLQSLVACKNQLGGALFRGSMSMAKLRELDVSGNSLVQLSTGTVSLPQVREVNLSYNRITELPDLTSWESVVSLYVEDNKIAELPGGFDKLETLRTVDLSGNELRRLEPRIGVMDKLETLRIAANPMRERKFMTMSTADVKRDLRARLGVHEPEQELD